MINNRLWEMLVAFYHSRTLTEAAERLYISQSSLSMGMKQLEKALNVQLFNRGKNSIELNAVGVEGARLAENYLAQESAIVKRLQVLDLREKTVTIASNAPEYKALLVQKLAAAFPNQNIDFKQRPSKVFLQGLLEGTFNYVLTEYPIQEPDIVCVPFMRDRLMIRLYHTDPLAGHASLSWDDIKDNSLLIWDNAGFWPEFIRNHFGERLNLVFIEKEEEFSELLEAFHMRSFVLESAVPPPAPSSDLYRYLPLAGMDLYACFYLCSLKAHLSSVQAIVGSI